MSRRKQITCVMLAVLTSGSILCPILQGIDAGAQTPNDSPLPLIDYLAQTGKEHDCFFTVEYALSEKDDPQNTIMGHWVRPSPSKDCQQALAQLASISNFSYSVEAANPRLIHIIDSRLLTQKTYALEAVIPRINYEGKLSDLPAAISKKGIPVSSPLVTFTGETADYDTTVRIAGEGLSVRAALSDFIPLDKRTVRILWTATTRLGERITYVRFPH